MSENQSGRWWEFYFIRYFVGSLVGALIIAASMYHPKSGLYELIQTHGLLPSDFSNLAGHHLFAIWVFGVAYCYVASIPVLVLHSLRCSIQFSLKPYEGQPAFARVRSYWRVIIVIIIPSSIFFLSDVELLKALALAGFYGVVLFQATLYFPTIFDGKLFEFYNSLAYQRSRKQKYVAEYVESYRHLREHGNAFLIVFYEVVLGVAIFESESLSDALYYLFVWLLPALPVWFIGTYLESKIADVRKEKQLTEHSRSE